MEAAAATLLQTRKSQVNLLYFTFFKNPFFTLTINGSKAKKGLAGAAAAAAVLCWQGNGEGGTMEKR